MADDESISHSIVLPMGPVYIDDSKKFTTL